MDTVIQKFRSALGGFNRQDVQAYIEETAAAHRKELAQLQERLEQAEGRTAELEAALSGAELDELLGRKQPAIFYSNDLCAKYFTCTGEGESRFILFDDAGTLQRRELSQTESKLVVAKRELERLQAQVGTLEPMAASYAQLKDRVATVELDAHRRAQDTVDEARAEAEKIRADTQLWLDGVLEQYGQLRRGMDQLLEQARILGRTAEQVGSLDEAARALRELGGLERTEGT